jgi:YD repeat-containing protein
MLLVLAGWTAPVFGQTPARYIYDDLGRLVTAIDPSGTQITYSYDTSGNILKVVRGVAVASDKLALLGFSPASGTAGTIVTITGQNFSPTPASNTLLFNGTPTAVLTANATTLTAAVPAAATTGPLSVTVNGATVVSASPFTVAATPVIQSISPQQAFTSISKTTLATLAVVGVNLNGATFSFSPVFNPAAIVVNSATIDPSGSSASLQITLAAGSTGSYSLNGTTAAGTSSVVATSANKLRLLNSDSDVDGDGLTNVVEAALNTDPSNPQTSGSGLSDGWQVFFGLSPLTTNGASQDPAGSGNTLLQDYQLGLSPRNANRVPPAVVKVSPANGATGVFINSHIVIRIGEPLQTGIMLAQAQTALRNALGASSSVPAASQVVAATTLQNYMSRTAFGSPIDPSAVSLTGPLGPVQGTTVVSNDGLSISFTPAQFFTAGSTYTLRVTGLRDIAGNVMANAFTSTFTSGTVADYALPTVVSVDPQTGTTNVPTNAHVTVQFSKAMDPETLTPATITITDQTTGKAVLGMVQVDASNTTAAFIPTTSLPIGRTFLAAISTGARDVVGNALAARSVSSFKTGYTDETAPPHLEASSPIAASINVPVNALLKFAFSQPLTITSVAPSIKVIATDGSTLAVQTALSGGDQQVTLTPINGLQANTQYTVTIAPGITNIAGIPLDNPQTYSFTASTLVDKTQPSILAIDPADASLGVPLNVKVRVRFSKAIDATSLRGGNLILYPASVGTSAPIASTISLSPDGTSATLAPAINLIAATQYCVSVNNVLDLVGQTLSAAGGSCFITGNSTQSTGPAVLLISPPNLASGVPVNALIQVALNEAVSAVSIGANAISLTANGKPITGKISQPSPTTLLFTPSGNLAANTTYSVAFDNVSDLAGNPAVPYAGTFSTSSSSIPDLSTATVLSVTPTSGATAVGVNTTIVATFSKSINPVSVNANTFSVQANGQAIAGAYSVNAATITFTPLTALPGNATIRLLETGVSDLVGVLTANIDASFTTAANADTQAPVVTLVTPPDGSTGIGLNGQIMVLFSKSVNPLTLTSDNIALLAGGLTLPFSPGISKDNRTLVLSGFSLPGSSVITLALSGGIKDLSGNALVNFSSQFTTASAFDTSSATVVSQRPGNGASEIAITASPVVLFLSKPLNTSSAIAAMHVTQNGQVVAGTVAVIGNGQTIQFTPSANWSYDALVQVFLDPSATDLVGNPVTAYAGSFRVVSDPLVTAPRAIATSPAPGAASVPLNVLINALFSSPLDPATAKSQNVQLINSTPAGQIVTPATVSLDTTGTVLHVIPNQALVPQSDYSVNTGQLAGTNGIAVIQPSFSFKTGSATQTIKPVVSTVSPQNNLTNVPLNALVSLQFNVAVDPTSVTGATITLSGGGQTLIPASIRFSSLNQLVQITPEAPLPPATVMTVTVQGVTDITGTAVAPFTSTFTTGVSPALARPGVIATNPVNAATGVPINVAFSLKANSLLDATSVNLSTFEVRDVKLNQPVSGAYSISADSTSVYFVPTAPLAISRNYTVYFDSRGLKDLVGNVVTSYCVGCLSNFSITTGLPSSATPVVTGISPAAGLAQVPLNARIVVAFNEPINGASAGGITLTAGGKAVATTIALSNGNALLTITPTTLIPSTAYLLTVAGITDVAGNAMSAPVTSTFTTGSGVDQRPLTIRAMDPAAGATGVPLNVQPRLGFNKAVNGISLGGGNVTLYPASTGLADRISGAIALSADATSATFTPTAALLPETQYCLNVATGVMDLGGLLLTSGGNNCFLTGTNVQTVGPTVTAVSPVDASTNVPVNALVELALNEPLSSVSINTTSITLQANGKAVDGAITLPDPSTLVFTPSAALSVNTKYTLATGGYTDLAGNASTPFTSSFTTSSTISADKSAATVISITPNDGTSGVPVNTAIAVTFSKSINPVSVNSNTFNVQANGQSISGSLTTSGALARFTPLTPLPGSATIRVSQNNILDFAGNVSNSSVTSFTTVATVDTSAPTVVLVTPSDGAVNIGLNGQVMVLFSKSMNPLTLNSSNIGIFARGVSQPFNPAVSADNRTLVLSGLNLPASSVITLAISNAVSDLSGNALANFTSQFTTASDFDTSSASVVTQRPANGAASVAVTASPIVLFLSKPLNASSVQGALHVSQNGQLIPGTITLVGNGQTINFTPTSAWTYGSLVEVFLDTSAVDLIGNPVTAYQGSFTVTLDPTSSTPKLLSVSPMDRATDVPLNAVVDIVYSAALDPATVTAQSVYIFDGSSGNTPLPAKLTLDATHTLLHIVPTALLAPNTRYILSFIGVQDTNGKTVNAPYTSFLTGTTTATVGPTVTLVSPADKLVNVPLNANLHIRFSAPVDSLSVTGTTVKLSGGGQTAVPASISFSDSNQNVLVTPQAPFLPNTPMTLTISGVTDVAGNTVTPFSSGFTTGNAPSVTTPGIIVSNPVADQVSVPVNVAISLRANAALDGITLSPSTFAVTDNTLRAPVLGALSLSADSTTAYFVPSTPLAAGRSYSIAFTGAGLTDLAGNPVTGSCGNCLSNFSFTTGFATAATAPQVVTVSPSSGLQQVPINAQILVAFNEPVSADTLTHVSLTANGKIVASTTSLSSGNQILRLVPSAGLLPNASYTINVSGVADLSSNGMTAPFTSTFATGSAADLRPLTLLAVDPTASSINVPLNLKARIGFSKPVSTVSLTNAAISLYPQAAGQAASVARAISVSPDGTIVTLTLSANLLPEITYCVNVGGIVDLVGQPLQNGSNTCFTTGTTTQSKGPSAVAVSPANGSSGVPVNASVQISLNEPVSVVSARNGSIVVTAGGSPVTGTITIPNPTTIIFTPSVSLAPSTTFNVATGPFTDLAGNNASPFASTFSTSASITVDQTQAAVVSVAPASGATGVAVNSPVTITFSKSINPVSVNSATFRVLVNNQGVAGTLNVNGATATFTPTSPLPASVSAQIVESGILDFAGNVAAAVNSSFVTAATADTTQPTVLLVTPANGSGNIGSGGQVTVLFSKSMNPQTLNTANIALLAQDAPLGFSISTSADNTTLILSGFTLPPSTNITLALSGSITDQSANPLADFTSQFTTAASFDTTSGVVIGQRPGNGAASVSRNASPLVLFINKALTPSSVQNALHVTQNGQLVAGTVAVVGNGQTVQFTPAALWNYGALVQVFLDATATDLSGNPVSPYAGSFTVITDPATTQPTLVSISPADGEVGVPTNAVLDVAFSGALDPASFSAGNIYLRTGFNTIPLTPTLDTSGSILHLVPSSPLSSSTYYSLVLQYVKAQNGLVLNSIYPTFTTGTTSTTTAPSVTTVSPSNNLPNVPLNAVVHLRFSTPMDAATINAATVTLTGGGQTLLPASISFTKANQVVLITPEAPLPPSTTMTIQVKGATDQAGNIITPFSSTFTTGTAPSTSIGIVITSPVTGETSVPVNSAISLAANAPIDAVSINSSTFKLFDTILNQFVSGTYSLSSDNATVYFLPAKPLATGRQYSLGFDNQGMTDVAGNPINSSCAGCLGNYSFITGFTTGTSAPQVTGISPATGLQQVPINAQIVVAFNEPVNGSTLNGVTLVANGNPVPVVYNLGNGNQRLTITPVAGLAPGTTYTLTIANVSDLSGNIQATPAASTFKTGTSVDLKPLTIVAIDPANSTISVPLNLKARIRFSKTVNVLTLSSDNIALYPSTAGRASRVAGTVTLTQGGASATFTPAANLLPETQYCIAVAGITDLVGLPLTGSASSCFTTGVATSATGPAVLAISPTNAATSVPVNAVIEASLNEPASAVSVGPTSVVVTANGQTVAGTVTLPTPSTLLFTPTNLLAPSTTYSVAIGGFTDLASNPASAFSSTFTSASSVAADLTQSNVISMSPADGSTNVATNVAISLTFSKPVNPTSANSGTVNITADGRTVSGTYAVSGAVITFTPLTTLPGTATIRINVNGVLDFANNLAQNSSLGFMTASTPDTSAPAVVLVTPTSGATGIGLNGQIMVLFSKSMNPTTLNSPNIILLSGGLTIPFSPAVSADNRTVVLSNLTLPPSSVITVAISSGVTDLSGNALPNFTTQFTTTAAFDTSTPTIVNQRPGNGATSVSLAASPIVLFASKPLDSSTVLSALHVTQNGQLVAGTASLIGNGQTVQFIPSQPWSYNSLVEIFLDATANGLNGIAITAYKGSFTTVTDPATTAPQLLNISPMNGAINVPVNTIVDSAFSVPLDPTTITAQNITLQNIGTRIAGAITLDASGTVVQFVPTAPLAVNTQFCFVLQSLKSNTGIAAPSQSICFTTGVSSQNTSPTVRTVSPADKLTGIAVNSNVSLLFNVPIDPVTVTGSSISVIAGGQTLMPSSISFKAGGQVVQITPEAPLPPGTNVTVQVKGVTDLAANVVTPFTSTFTTGKDAAISVLGILVTSPAAGASAVPVNATVSLSASNILDGTSVSPSTFTLIDNTLNQPVSGTFSLSSDSRTVYFVPSASLATGRTYAVNFDGRGITDTAGNSLTANCAGCLGNFAFTTGFAASTSAPKITGVSPTSTQPLVPINAQTVVTFDEPVNLETLGGIALSANGKVLPLTSAASNGSQTITVVPTAGLSANTTYTLSVASVADVGGNPMKTPFTSTFATSSAADLSIPSVVSTAPKANATGVLTTSTVAIAFSKAMNILSLNPTSVTLAKADNTPIPGTIATDAAGRNFTFTPASPLLPQTSYMLQISTSAIDLEGQPVTAYTLTFTTGSQ